MKFTSNTTQILTICSLLLAYACSNATVNASQTKQQAPTSSLKKIDLHKKPMSEYKFDQQGLNIIPSHNSGVIKSFLEDRVIQSFYRIDKHQKKDDTNTELTIEARFKQLLSHNIKSPLGMIDINNKTMIELFKLHTNNFTNFAKIENEDQLLINMFMCTTLAKSIFYTPDTIHKNTFEENGYASFRGPLMTIQYQNNRPKGTIPIYLHSTYIVKQLLSSNHPYFNEIRKDYPGAEKFFASLIMHFHENPIFSLEFSINDKVIVPLIIDDNTSSQNDTKIPNNTSFIVSINYITKRINSTRNPLSAKLLSTLLFKDAAILFINYGINYQFVHEVLLNLLNEMPKNNKEVFIKYMTEEEIASYKAEQQKKLTQQQKKK